ncbi:Toll-like receptor 13 Precursor [Channa argus]|uniref:Toll-like receptor 13 n=1 Tax=Channa argus TaxID=215402 RepID=A0A6G1QM56_CHAAH|nr:Toll-like receptor 13 Precursor [Channa argus]
MSSGRKEDQTILMGGRKRLQRVILFCLLNFSTLIVPGTGLTLRTCRISYNVALCVKTKLTAVPRDIPSTVTGFDLSLNRISRIQISDFKNLLALEKLDLNFNNISQIDNGAFASLICLKTLNLNNNRLVKLGEDLFNGLTNLTELRVNRNKIQIVASTAFQSLQSLKLLDISSNKLRHITNVHLILQQLPHLRTLSIRNNNLTTFDSWELTNSSIELSYLDVSLNPFTVFRITADVFPSLIWLNLGGSSRKYHMKWEVHNKTFLSRVSTLDISGLQMDIGDMKTLLQTVNSSLESLRMNEMKHNLKELISISCTIPTMSKLQLRRNYKRISPVSSDVFKLCINLTELDLSNNHIKNIQDNAFRPLKYLRILSLGQNMLSSVPEATRNLAKLAELDLNNNKISSLGCDDFTNLTMLRELSLNQNSISAVKECVFKDLFRLQVLKLQSNHISTLNNAFKNPLPNLRQLLLHTNKLTALKRGEFQGLESLSNLSLHHNQIKELEGGCFTGLTNLTTILLQNNHITKDTLTESVFKDLINLRRLDLRDNCIKYENTLALREPPFSHLSRLEMLAIPSQHCKRKSELPYNLLQGLTNLLFFNIRDIQLISLDSDMFTFTPQLQTLDMSSNDIRNLSSELFSPVRNLKSLYISRISLGSLDFLVDANLTQLEFLQARKNQFSVISKDIIYSTPALLYLDLQGNSFTCDCDNAGFIQWVQSNNKTQVFDAYNFVCNYPSDLKGMKLLDFDIRFCSVDVEFICFVSTTCTILLFMVLSYTYHILRWQLVYAYYLFLAFLFDTKNKNKQAPSQYDAFISYNVHDEPWVMGELLPKLEGEQGWRLCLHHRDFEPGKPIIDNVTDSIYGSRKTICVISHKYLESEWCSREIQVASFRLFDERKDVLILVFLEEIPASLLSPYYRLRKLVKRKTYLSWPRAGEHTELFWQKLCQALRSREDFGEDRFLLTVMDRPHEPV